MKVLLRTAFFVLLAAFIMLPLAGCKHTHKTYVNAPPRHHVKPAPPRHHVKPAPRRSFVPAPKHRAPAPRYIPAPRRPGKPAPGHRR